MKDPALPLSEGDVNLSPSRAAWRASLSERARDALDDDERYFLRQSLSTPCLTQIVRAEGAVLTDVDGRRIFDFHGNSVHQLGHGHPKIVAAIRREMETLPFCPRRYANSTATALARRLVETSPAGLDKVLFAPSGASPFMVRLSAIEIGAMRKFALVSAAAQPAASAADRCAVDQISTDVAAGARNGFGRQSETSRRSLRKRKNSTPSCKRRFIISGLRTISPTIAAILGTRK